MGNIRDHIPYVVVESMMSQAERTIRRLWILCIILIVLCVGTNIAWILYENQFQTITETTTQEVSQDGGNNLFVGRDYADSKDTHN